jgi:hypothetical protein
MAPHSSGFVRASTTCGDTSTPKGECRRIPRPGLYLGISQKNRSSLEAVQMILKSWEIDYGRIHNPSQSVDPDYWRFYIRSESRRRFMAMVGSWHPRKRRLMEARMKI